METKMKVRHICGILFFCLIIYKITAQDLNGPFSFSQNIFYKEQILGTNLGEVRKAWWHDRLEPTVQYGFITPFLEKVKNNRMDVYNPNEPFRERMTNPQARNLLFNVDSMMTYQETDMETPVLVTRVEELLPDKIKSVMFNENWIFDAGKMTFEKTVKGMLLIKSEMQENSGSIRERYLFYVPFHQAKDAVEKGKIPLLTKRITYDVRIKEMGDEKDTVTYAYMALADGVKIEVSEPGTERHIYDENANDIIQKIEVIDTIKYVDKNGYEIRFEKSRVDTVRYPRGLIGANIKTIIAALYTPVINGKLTAYAPVFPYDKALSKTDVKAITERKDTIMQLNRLFTTQTDTFISGNKLTEDQVTSLRFYESWYYDSTQTVLYKKVNGVMLLRDIPGKSEYEWGSKELFYIPLNSTQPTKKDKQARQPAESPAQMGYNISLDSLPYFQKIVGIDSTKLTSLMGAVIYGAQEGRLTVGDAGYNYSTLPNIREFLPITHAEIKNILNPIPDSIFSMSVDANGNEILNKVVGEQIQIKAKDIRGISFIEDWTFDADKVHFEKIVKGIYPGIKKFSEAGEFRGLKSLFYLPFAPGWAENSNPPISQDYSAILKTENLLGENIFYYVPINTDDNYSDGMEISSSPSWIENLEYSKREAIVKKLIDLTLEEKITPYIPGTSTPMNIAEFKKRLVKQVNEGEKTIEIPMKYYDVAALGFEEAWYANLDKLLFYKNVKKLYFATYTNDTETGIRKYKPLVYFMVK